MFSVTRSSLFAVIRPAVLSVIVGACAVALAADELPEDTNKIESLTPAQAKKLVAEFPGVTVRVMNKEGRFIGQLPDALPVNGLTSLEASTAQVLAAYERGPILLNGLTTIPPETAKAIAEFKCDTLVLNGLTTLTPEAANALGGFKGKGDLYLCGLTTLSPDAAKGLAEFQGQTLNLDGLTTLSPEVARSLGESQSGWLVLNGLTTITRDAVAALAGYRGWLYLRGLITLTPEEAKALAEFTGQTLVLDGVTTLPPEAAQALAKFKGELLFLEGLTTLSPEAAQALAGFNGGYLYLSGITTLSPEAAKALAEFKGVLYLDGLTTLSPEAAKALAEFEGGAVDLGANVYSMLGGQLPLTVETAKLACLRGRDPSVFVSLDAVTALNTRDSVAIAKTLAACEATLSLPKLKKISPKTLTALIEKEDVQIPPIDTLDLIAEPDGSATEDFVVPKRLQPK